MYLVTRFLPTPPVTGIENRLAALVYQDISRTELAATFSTRALWDRRFAR